MIISVCHIKKVVSEYIGKRNYIFMCIYSNSNHNNPSLKIYLLKQYRYLGDIDLYN